MIYDFSDKGYIFIYPRECGERYLDAACSDTELKKKLIGISDNLYRLYKEQITAKTFEGNFTGEMLISTATK